MLFAGGPDAVVERTGFRHGNESAPEFLMIGGFHLAAQLRTKGLLAVADAKKRQAHFEHHLGNARRFAERHRGRPAGEHDAPGIEGRDPFGIAVER